MYSSSLLPRASTAALPFPPEADVERDERLDLYDGGGVYEPSDEGSRSEESLCGAAARRALAMRWMRLVNNPLSTVGNPAMLGGHRHMQAPRRCCCESSATTVVDWTPSAIRRREEIVQQAIMFVGRFIKAQQSVCSGDVLHALGVTGGFLVYAIDDLAVVLVLCVTVRGCECAVG